MHSRRPFNVVDGIQMDFHESTDEEIVVSAQVQLVSNTLIIRRIEIWKVVFFELRELSPTLVFIGATINAMIKIVSTAYAESKPSKQDLEIGR